MSVSPKFLERLSRTRIAVRKSTPPNTLLQLHTIPETIEERVKILKTPHKQLLNRVLSKLGATTDTTHSELTLTCAQFVRSLATNEEALRKWEQYIADKNSLPHKQLYPALAAAALRALVQTGQWPKLSSTLAQIESHPDQSVKPYLTLISSLSACNRQQAALKVVDRMNSHKLFSPVAYIPIIKDPHTLPALLESKSVKPELLSSELLRSLVARLLVQVTEQTAASTFEFAMKLLALFEKERQVKPCWHTICLLLDTRWCVNAQQFHGLLDLIDLHRHRYCDHTNALAKAVLLATMKCDPFKDFQVMQLLYEWFHPRLPFSMIPISAPSSFWASDAVFRKMAQKDLTTVLPSAQKRQLARARVNPAGVFSSEVYNALLCELARQYKIVHAVSVMCDLQVLHYRPSAEAMVLLLRAAGYTRQKELLHYLWKMAEPSLRRGKRYFKMLCELVNASDLSYHSGALCSCVPPVLRAINLKGFQSGTERAFGNLVYRLAKRNLMGHLTMYRFMSRFKRMEPLLRLYMKHCAKTLDRKRMMAYLSSMDFARVTRLWWVFKFNLRKMRKKFYVKKVRSPEEKEKNEALSREIAERKFRSKHGLKKKDKIPPELEAAAALAMRIAKVKKVAPPKLLQVKLEIGLEREMLM